MRSAAETESAMELCAREMLASPKPPRKHAAANMGRLFTRRVAPMNPYQTVEAASEPMRIGRRPKRSDSAPSTGAPTNWPRG